MNERSYRSPKTEVRGSPIHGQGLFAKVDIAAGEIVAVKGGSILTAEEWAELEPTLGAADIQISEDLFVAPTSAQRRDANMLNTNHSCSPNVGIQGQVVFVAMRDISADEELTHDWATADDADYQMECRCGSAVCRGVITGQDWRKPELQAKYAG